MHPYLGQLVLRLLWGVLLVDQQEQRNAPLALVVGLFDLVQLIRKLLQCRTIAPYNIMLHLFHWQALHCRTIIYSH
jgi:hypothetical protein